MALDVGHMKSLLTVQVFLENQEYHLKIATQMVRAIFRRIGSMGWSAGSVALMRGTPRSKGNEPARRGPNSVDYHTDRAQLRACSVKPFQA